MRTVGLAETAAAIGPDRRNIITKWLSIEENVDVIDDEVFDLVSYPINLDQHTSSQPLLMDNSSELVKDSIMKSVTDFIDTANCSQLRHFNVALNSMCAKIQGEVETQLNFYS